MAVFRAIITEEFTHYFGLDPDFILLYIRYRKTIRDE